MEERRQDSNERLAKLEVISSNMHIDFSRLHDDLKSLEKALDNHGKDEAATFQEINKALVVLSSTVREISVSITDLRDTVKDLKESQQLMYKELVVLQGVATTVDELKKKVETLEVAKNEFNEYKAAGKASWKVISIVATIVSAIWAGILAVLKYALS